MKVEKYDFVSRQTVEEIKSDVVRFKHQKSGANIMFYVNDDEHRCFSASFKTPPNDDTGLPHIMEHSVLCGSRKYPSKEPFVELMKGSLNTFLNAMTFSDKTMYPIASCNEKDFYNLTDVYLDAVFFPLLEKEAFLQEGWHYELSEDKKSLIYKGVVYNEMQGVYSSPESHLVFDINRSIFPDSIYGLESGGFPESITDLSYEEYLAFHKKYYHPENSYIQIYGDVDIEKFLAFLDEGFLNEFTATGLELPILEQPRFSEPVELESTYASEESVDDSTYMAMTFVQGKTTDLFYVYSMMVLDYVLLGSSASLLRKALLEAKLGDDILDYGFDHDSLECTYSMGVKGSSPEKKEAFVKLIFSELQKIVENGVPEKLSTAAVNSIEFQLREANFGSYPKGIIYFMSTLGTWLYDDNDGISPLEYEDALKFMKEGIKQGGFFEGLIQKHFLDNPHYSVVVCKPDAKKQELEAQRIEKLLADKMAKLEDAELNELVAMQEKLLERQNTPDSQEALDAMPKLTREDLTDDIELIESRPGLIAGKVASLIQPQPCNAVIYYQLNFNADSVGEELLPYLAAFGGLYMKVGSKNFAYDTLAQEFACETGGLSNSISITAHQDADQPLNRRFAFRGKVMSSKLPELKELLSEVLNEVDFSNKERIKELLIMTRSRLQDVIQTRGERITRLVIASWISELGMANERISGLSYFKFLDDLVTNFDERFDDFRAKLLEIKKLIFTEERLLVTVTAEEEDCSAFTEMFSALLPCLSQDKTPSQPFEFSAQKKKAAMPTKANIQCVGQAVKIPDFEYNGSFEVLQQFLSTGYLWENVRVKGGAYGCFMTLDKLDKTLGLYSYRDPNLDKTLEAFDEIEKVLENLELNDEEFLKLLIGTMGRVAAPMTPSQKGGLSVNRYLAGITDEDLIERRKQILRSKPSDLKAYSTLFKTLREEGSICVHGSELTIEKSKDLFEEMIKLGE